MQNLWDDRCVINMDNLPATKRINYHNDRAIIVPEEPLPAGHDEFQRKIDQLEAEMAKGETVDSFPLRHYFAKDVYVREFTLPKGYVVTGKVHKYSHVIILLTGEVSVNMGDGIKRIKAPFVAVTPAGSRRVVYAHEDAVFLTAHGTPERDLDLIEENIIAQTWVEYVEWAKSIEHKSSAWNELKEHIA